MILNTTISILSHQQDFCSGADSALVLSYSFLLLEPFQHFHESSGQRETSDPTRAGTACGAKGQFWLGRSAGPEAREKLPILWPRAPCALNMWPMASPFPLAHGYCCIFQDPLLLPGENQGPLQRHYPWTMGKGFCNVTYPQNGQNKSITSSCSNFHLHAPKISPNSWLTP